MARLPKGFQVEFGLGIGAAQLVDSAALKQSRSNRLIQKCSNGSHGFGATQCAL